MCFQLWPSGYMGGSPKVYCIHQLHVFALVLIRNWFLLNKRWPPTQICLLFVRSHKVTREQLQHLHAWHQGGLPPSLISCMACIRPFTSSLRHTSEEKTNAREPDRVYSRLLWQRLKIIRERITGGKRETSAIDNNIRRWRLICKTKTQWRGEGWDENAKTKILCCQPEVRHVLQPKVSPGELLAGPVSDKEHSIPATLARSGTEPVVAVSLQETVQETTVQAGMGGDKWQN